MSEHEAHGRALYDHDDDEPRRRRRPAADWGVGEELFDHLPGRRFERRPGDRVPRGGVADGRRTIRIGEPADDPAPEPAAEQEFASRDEALRARGGRRTVRIDGRPGEVTVRRQRPPRTVSERVGPRPDRVAAWAFALGILLILIAVATAGL